MNYGALSTEDRAKAIKAIQDPNSKVRFLVTPQTGGYGNAKIMRKLKPWSSTGYVRRSGTRVKVL